jgi:hypothetical protein
MEGESTFTPITTSNNSHQYTTDLVEEYMSDSPLLDSLVSAANVVNKVFNASACARLMCQVYTEKQIEYEIRQDRLIQSPLSEDDCRIPLTASEDSGCTSQSHSPVDRAFMKCSPSTHGGMQGPENEIQIQMYRQFLFDEASVVDAVQGRSEEEED